MPMWQGMTLAVAAGIIICVLCVLFVNKIIIPLAEKKRKPSIRKRIMVGKTKYARDSRHRCILCFNFLFRKFVRKERKDSAIIDGVVEVEFRCVNPACEASDGRLIIGTYQDGLDEEFMTFKVVRSKDTKTAKLKVV